MNKRVLAMAEEAGLTFDLDAVKPTNSFDAHRLIQLSKKYALQDMAEEKLFEAFFSKGLHIGDKETLRKIGEEAGMDAEEVDRILLSDLYSEEVKEDERLASQFGISGVPFFVFDRKYAISGAQPVQAFVDVLEEIRLKG